MVYSFHNPDSEIILNYLKQATTIAVVGLSNREETAAYRVSKFMKEAGYRIIPVNPRAMGQEILGEKVYSSIQDIPVPIDVVNVFRRSEYLAEVAREFIKTDAKVYWAQLGLESQEAETILRQAERNDIVMNKCIKIEYAQLRDKLI